MDTDNAFSSNAFPQAQGIGTEFGGTMDFYVYITINQADTDEGRHAITTPQRSGV